MPSNPPAGGKISVQRVVAEVVGAGVRMDRGFVRSTLRSCIGSYLGNTQGTQTYFRSI